MRAQGERHKKWKKDKEDDDKEEDKQAGEEEDGEEEKEGRKGEEEENDDEKEDDKEEKNEHTALTLEGGRKEEEKEKRKMVLSKTGDEQAFGIQTGNISKTEAFCFSSPLSRLFSSPRVRTLIRCGKDELGGFALSILISGNSLIREGARWGGNGLAGRGVKGKREGRGQHKRGERDTQRERERRRAHRTCCMNP